MASLVDVSTTVCELLQPREEERCEALHRLLAGLAEMRDLLGPEQIFERLDALDEFDAIIGDLDPEANAACSDSPILAFANALRTQFEAANEELFRAARAEISLHGDSRAMRRWLSEAGRERDGQGPRAGFGFDLLDEIVSGVLQIRRPGEADVPRCAEIVPYQPTPARHIADLIQTVALSEDDVLVDLGSGLGHVPLLVSILTGVRTIGVELEPAYVASAQESARNLRLSRVLFVEADARIADLSMGTVFYLFSPFKGSILRDVLQRLFEESSQRPIRICSLGPCTGVLQDEEWLRAKSLPTSGRITVFEPR